MEEEARRSGRGAVGGLYRWWRRGFQAECGVVAGSGCAGGSKAEGGWGETERLVNTRDSDPVTEKKGQPT